MVGGPEAEFAEALPVLEALGKPTHVGAIGAGHALKAINNLMSAAHLWVSSEAMLTGIAFGLDRAGDGRAAGLGEPLPRRLGDVEAADRVARVDEPARHGRAHVAQADERDRAALRSRAAHSSPSAA